LSVNSANAQIVKWTFDGESGTDLPFQTVANLNISNLLQGNNYGVTTLITASSSSSGYTGASGDFNAAAATVSAAFDKSTSTYFEFTITPDEGYSVIISAINFGSRSTGTGPQTYSLTSSIDSYNSDISKNTLSADSKWHLYQNTVTSIFSGSAITFRIYGFDGTGSSHNTAVWRIDDLSITVSLTPIQTSYRTHQSGNWASPSTWEYSTDNVNWNISTSSPSKDDENILIQSGHTVIVNSAVSLDQTTIAGTLKLQTGGTLTINNGNGDDILIPANGVLQITNSNDYATSVIQADGATIDISTNGKIEIGDGSSSTGNGYESFATSTKNVWNDGAVFEYNCDKTFAAPGLIYFPNVAKNVIPVFRVSTVSGTPGSGSTKDFYVYGILEVNCDFTFAGTGDKYFRNGIRGAATLTVTGTGQIFLNGENAILDGSPLNIILNLNHPLKLINKCNVPEGAHIIVSGSNLDNNLAGNIFTIDGTLDVTDQGISNKYGKIILNGFYRTANEGGFSGSGSSIVSGDVTVNPGSTVELYANDKQSLNKRTDFSNLIFSGSGIKTPKGSFSPAGTVTIKDEAIFDCSGRDIGDETESGTTATNLTMSGNSRLIVDTYGPNPKMTGVYNLTGGIIEFKCSGATPQTIRKENYQNIEVTGTNVLMSDGNITLNEGGTFTVKDGGTFTINDNTIIGQGNGSETITVESGGNFKCGNNKGFNGSYITSAPIQSSSIHKNITKIFLEPNSTVEYSREGNQPITNADELIYQNLIISGSGNKTAPSDNLIIQGNLSKTSTAQFIHNNGTVIFNGSSSQAYSCAAPEIIFNNLVKENQSELIINSALSVYNQLLWKDYSTISLNADITLLSGRNHTASVGQLSTLVDTKYGSGRFIIERYINTNTKDGGHPKSWQFLSAPAYGETIFDTWQEKGSTTISGYGTWITDKMGSANGFDAASVAPSMKYFNPASNNWIGIPNTNTSLENKNGYMIFVRGDRQSRLVNSPATPTILRTRGEIYTAQMPPPPITVLPGKFESIGNPYASVIDFSKINFSNIAASYTAWDPTLGDGQYGLGGYQTITAATNYRAVPGNTSIYNSTSDYRNIQSGQAFFVFNYTTFPGSISFTEECKVSSGQHLVNREPDEERAILLANLMLDGVLADGNAVAFDKKFSNAIDAEDALKINNAGENFAIKCRENILAVEARNEIRMTDTIFYHLNNLAKQNYQLAFIPLKIQVGFEAYLTDQFLKTKCL
jgi:hypothetical protein